jgi:thiol:disulfide interchange protein DsbC
MKGLDNVTIYTFLFPIDQLHPDAARKSRQIWCAPDKVKAWDEFFATGKVPDNAGDCGDPVEKTQALGNSMRITATPTLVFADGSVVPGALPLAQLEKQLAEAEAEAKKLASSASK